MATVQVNAIYCGDCKGVLHQYIPDNSIDLIYIDPPFFSNKKYEQIWKDGYELRAFEDRWKGGIENYLAWMDDKLRECYRVLKPTGTFWLHCDRRAVHYLKVLLDRNYLFGESNFRNEIIWNHQILGAAHGLAFPKAHETLLRYTKSNAFTFNEHDSSVRVPFSDYILKDLKKDPKTGKWYYTRRRMSRKIREGEETHGLRTYVDDPKQGKLVGDVWGGMGDTEGIRGYQPKEKLGYPTQKPEALLNRIIRVCSNPTDIVLDPMCGCGTAIVSAQRQGRRWIGIDISPTACKLMASRMRKLGVNISEKNIIGLPKTLKEIQEMQPFEFQNWVMQKLMARISKTLSSDMGIDGWTLDNRPIQVKQSEGVGRNIIDNFETALTRANKKSGIIVAISFGKGAYEEVARAKLEQGLEIELKTVKDIIAQE